MYITFTPWYLVNAQVVLSWADGAGRTVRRVVTRKLQTTTVLSAYVRDLDVPLSAVLLAKGVVQDAVRSEAAANDELAPIRASIGESALLFRPSHTPQPMMPF